MSSDVPVQRVPLPVHDAPVARQRVEGLQHLARHRPTAILGKPRPPSLATGAIGEFPNSRALRGSSGIERISS